MVGNNSSTDIHNLNKSHKAQKINFLSRGKFKNELWLPVEGQEDMFASNHGRVISKGKVHEAKCPVSYAIVSYKKDNGKYSPKSLHRIIAETWIDNPNNEPFVCHIDDNPKNNHIDNLYWGNRTTNHKDAVRNGNRKVSSKHRISKKRATDICQSLEFDTTEFNDPIDDLHEVVSS